MNELVRVADIVTLPALIDRAAQALTGARSSAEVLEARDLAGIAYDAAKKAARLAAAKGAFNALVAASNRAQADALEIEAQANRRLADEYDAAQERGEVRGDRQRTASSPEAVSASDLGLTHKAIHEARKVRDAEKADPGIVRRTLDDALANGEEPTRAKVKRAIEKRVKRARGARFKAPEESQHDRDLRMLLGVWETACESAREEFLDQVTQ